MQRIHSTGSPRASGFIQDWSPSLCPPHPLSYPLTSPGPYISEVKMIGRHLQSIWTIKGITKTQVIIVIGVHPASTPSCLTAARNLLLERSGEFMCSPGQENVVLPPWKGGSGERRGVGERSQERAGLCRMLAFPGREEEHTALGTDQMHRGEQGGGPCSQDGAHSLPRSWHPISTVATVPIFQPQYSLQWARHVLGDRDPQVSEWKGSITALPDLIIFRPRRFIS